MKKTADPPGRRPRARSPAAEPPAWQSVNRRLTWARREDLREEVARLAKAGKVSFVDIAHVFRRLDERGATVQDVYSVLENPVTVEAQRHGDLLIDGRDPRGAHLAVVASIEDDLVVVTVLG